MTVDLKPETERLVVAFLRESPLARSEIDLEKERDLGREIDL
jgi:hypothetical protein